MYTWQQISNSNAVINQTPNKKCGRMHINFLECCVVNQEKKIELFLKRKWLQCLSLITSTILQNKYRQSWETRGQSLNDQVSVPRAGVSENCRGFPALPEFTCKAVSKVIIYKLKHTSMINSVFYTQLSCYMARYSASKIIRYSIITYVQKAYDSKTKIGI